MESIEMLDMLGVKFGEIPGMVNEGCYVSSQHVVLFRAGLSEDRFAVTAADLLSEVLAHQLASLSR